MKIDVDALKPGMKLFTKDEDGYDGWYPFVTVIGKSRERGRVHVRFSDGHESRMFSPNGDSQFEILKMRMENK